MYLKGRVKHPQEIPKRLMYCDYVLVSFLEMYLLYPAGVWIVVTPHCYLYPIISQCLFR